MRVENPIGRTLGRYELRDKLGEGAMGWVYRAWDPNLKREVAIKVMRPVQANKANFGMRFRREAQMVAGLQHTNIIMIFDFGTQGQYNYLVMPLLTGGSLQEQIEQSQGQPWNSISVSDLLMKLAAALDHAHEKGIIHRDIKPANIVFDDYGTPFLVDFGIAKVVRGHAASAETGVMAGTPVCMAPEQWKQEEVVDATDQYAVAVVAYALLTGQYPFMAQTRAQMMFAHVNSQPQPPHMLNNTLSRDVSAVLLRALAKDPARRYPNVMAFANDFAAAVGLPVGNEATNMNRRPTGGFPATVPVAKPAKPPRRLSSSKGPNKLLPIALIVAAVVLIVVAAVLIYLGSRDNDEDSSNDNAGGAITMVTSANEVTSTNDEVSSGSRGGSATATATADAATPSATVEATTAVPTDDVTEEPVDDPVVTVDGIVGEIASQAAVVPVRNGPGDYFTMIGTVADGEQVEVLSRAHREPFYLVKLPDETTAWVERSDVRVIDDNIDVPVLGAVRNSDWEVVTRTDSQGIEMVQVPSGCFVMGTGTTSENAEHEQCIEYDFWLDRTEVTRGSYNDCVDDGACTAALDSGLSTRSSQPINRVNWNQAVAYCEWRGGRLPTEREWEYAARGPDELTFPWGDHFDNGLAAYAANTTETAAVGSFLGGASWVGALDMSGNVWEWVSSRYLDYPYQPNDGREANDDEGARVVRGGSILDEQALLSTPYRHRYGPTVVREEIGFRCAADATTD